METQGRPGQRKRWRWTLRPLYIYLCINICPVLTQHKSGVVMKRFFYALETKLQSVRTQTELELPATNATCTMAAFVSPAGVLRRKATDSLEIDNFYTVLCVYLRQQRSFCRSK